MKFIEVNNFSFRYSPGNEVLSNISFELDAGEVLAVLGPSGAGKTTLLRVLAGLSFDTKSVITEGSATVCGMSPAAYRERSSLAFMFQEPTLLPHMSVYDNIALPLRILGRGIDDLAVRVMETVGLSRFSEYLPKDLSGGMRTRVSLARSFITSPTLLLLDEPFASLDFPWRRCLCDELELLRQQTPTTVVIVTHDIGEAIRLATRVVVLSSSGSIEFIGDVRGNNSLHELRSRIESALLKDHPAITRRTP
jgi:ABC-type nitrate/sulfonate/bicarbonate transport system ATPase subunit